MIFDGVVSEPGENGGFHLGWAQYKQPSGYAGSHGEADHVNGIQT
jgi:hypothetical protein